MNESQITHCDMCGTKIENNRCSCGIWKSAEEMKDHPYKKGLEFFHEQRKMTSTMDSPHLGVAAVYFRGDYNDCLEVAEFIKKMKRRAHYEDIL